MQIKSQIINLSTLSTFEINYKLSPLTDGGFDPEASLFITIVTTEPRYLSYYFTFKENRFSLQTQINNLDLINLDRTISNQTPYYLIQSYLPRLQEAFPEFKKVGLNHIQTFAPIQKSSNLNQPQIQIPSDLNIKLSYT